MNKRLLAFLEALLVVALWSASPPLAKLAYSELNPIQLTAIRYGGAALILLPFAWVRSGSKIRALRRGDWFQLLLMGILGFSLGNAILYTGLKSLPATTTSFMLNGIPLATVCLGLLALGERPRLIQWAGIVVALLGGFVFFGWNIELNQVRMVGWSLLGVFLISIFGLLARHMTRLERIDPISLSAFPMGFGALCLFAFVSPIPRISWPIIGILLWLTFVNSAIAFVLWNHALKNMQAFEISITGNLMPIGTALLAPVFLGEPVSNLAWLGMLISLAGVILVGIGGQPAG